MMDAQSKGKALGRLRRIEGQVQGIQRMVEEDKYCVDILLQLTAVQGAVEQVQKLLLGQPLEKVVNREAMANPGCLDWYVALASRVAGRR